MKCRFGKILSHIRVEKGLKSKNMAKDLDCNMSFLSSIEHGRRPVPIGLVEKIIDKYEIIGSAKEELRASANETISTICLNVGDDKLKRDLLIRVATCIEDITIEDLERISKILNKY